MNPSLPLLLVMWLNGPVLAAVLPAVEARVDTARVTLGDPVELTLRLRLRSWEKPALPPVARVLPGFFSRLEAGGGSEAVDGGVERVWRYELRFYSLGLHRIPPLPVTFIQTTGDTLVRATQPLEIEVVSVRREGEEVELGDIRPPVGIPGGVPLWLAAMLAALLLVALAAAVYWLLQRPSRKGEEAPAVAPTDFAAEFSRIAAMGLVERGEFKRYYSLLSENMRRYLEAELQVEAMERTTDEIASALRRIDLEDGARTDLEEYLRAADMVKFARFSPEIASARRAPASGASIVRAVEAAMQAAAEPQAFPDDSGEPPAASVPSRAPSQS